VNVINKKVVLRVEKKRQTQSKEEVKKITSRFRTQISMKGKEVFSIKDIIDD
jgi:hypothetical protein